ncbi:MAG: hypothetical protein M9957_00815 [Rhodobacteraceae bacterium]|nr:hypothetical protein [Paracoccaceae bacterium]
MIWRMVNRAGLVSTCSRGRITVYLEGADLLLGDVMNRKCVLGKARGAWIAMAAVLIVAGCNRDKVELTQCEEGVAEISRTADVAPPNC